MYTKYTMYINIMFLYAYFGVLFINQGAKSGGAIYSGVKLRGKTPCS